MPTSQRQRAEAFLAMHREGKLLVLPNAWDPGSARLIAAAGARAIATSSAAVAFARGWPDGERMPRDTMLAEVALIARAVDLPVTADLEAGYAADAPGVGDTMARAIAAGAVGANLEDGTGKPDHPLLAVAEGAARVEAAVAAAKRAGMPFALNARIDTYICGKLSPEEAWRETLARAEAYKAAGAACLFVPVLTELERIRALVAQIRHPVNIMLGPRTPPLAELERAGVARVSAGGATYRHAMCETRRAVTALLGADETAFASTELTYGELNKLHAAGLPAL